MILISLVFSLIPFSWGRSSYPFFHVVLESIPPMMPCSPVGSNVSLEDVSETREYLFIFQVLESAGFVFEEDFDFLCVDNFPEDWLEGYYINFASFADFLEIAKLSPVISKTSNGMVTKFTEEPGRILQGFEPEVFALLFLTPLATSIFSLLDEDWSFLYHVSNYLGLLFFQSEINFQVPVNRFLINLSVQLINLVFFSIYFWYLERVVDGLKTMGGMEKDADYYRQKIYIDSWMYSSYVNNMYIPVPYEHENINDLFDENYIVSVFQDQNLFPFHGDRIQIFKMELFICDFHYVENPINFVNLHFLFSPLVDQGIQRAMAPFVVEQQMYIDFALDYDYAVFYPEVEACEDRGHFSNFQLIFSDFYYLWLIFGAGLIVSLMVFVFQWLFNRWKAKKGKLVLGGIRASKNREIKNSLRNGLVIYSGISITVARYLEVPLINFGLRIRMKKFWKKLGKEKVKRTAEIMEKKLSKTHLEFASRKENDLKLTEMVAQHIFVRPKSLKRINKVSSDIESGRILKLFVESETFKGSHVNKRKECNELGRKGKRIKREIGLGSRRLNKFYFEVLKDLISRILQINGIVTEPYLAQLPVSLSGKGYQINSVFLLLVRI